MRKRLLIIMGVILIILIVGGYYFYEHGRIKHPRDIQVETLNEACPKDTFCVPFKPECGHWRITNYAPYKYCSVSELFKEQCKDIENQEWAVYCMALKATNEECLEFAGDNKKLQAVCHIDESGQLLFPRETFDPEVYVDKENNIIEGEISYYIMTNCSDMTGTTCNVLVWEE